MRNLITAMTQDKDIEATLISSSGPNISLNVAHVSYASCPWKDTKALSLVWSFYRAIQRISDSHEIIHLFLPNPAFGFLADLIKKKTRKTVIVTYESHYHSPVKELITPRLSRFYVKDLVRLLLCGRFTSTLSHYACDQYVVSSHFQKRQLLEIGYPEEKIAVIPNSTNTERYYFQGPGADRREKYQLNGEKIISYIGHFNHSKGVETLVRAFSYVVGDDPRMKGNTRLILAGSGARGGEASRIGSLIKRLNIQDYVRILGVVDVAELLSLSHVFVLPYLYVFNTRMFPNIILEAFAVGVPLIVTNVEPLTEIVQHGVTGVVTPVNNPRKLAENITEMLINDSRSETIINNQRRIVKEKFDAPIVYEQHKGLYMRVLGG